MYAIASFNDAKFQPLADITDAVKREYCERHGYSYFVKTDVAFTPDIGFEKIRMVLDLFDKHPDIEWLLFCESDAIVSNFNIKIEDRIDNRYHFIVATDINDINAGVFLARNSSEGRKYLNYILKQRPKYQDNWQAEQGVIQDTFDGWRHAVRVVPQRTMNSFQYQFYRYGDHRDRPPHRDIMGNDGNWQQGDWILHWPGMSLENRLQVSKQMIPYIVK
jgi:hypothetical protein